MCIMEHSDGPELCHCQVYSTSGGVGVVFDESKKPADPFKLVFVGSWTICDYRMVSGGRVTKYVDWIKQVTGIDYDSKPHLVF